MPSSKELREQKKKLDLQRKLLDKQIAEAAKKERAEQDANIVKLVRGLAKDDFVAFDADDFKDKIRKILEC